MASSKYMPEYSGSGYRAHKLYKRLTKKHPEVKLTVLAGSISENSSAVYEYDGIKVQRIAGKKYLQLPGNTLKNTFRRAVNFKSEYKLTYKFLSRLDPVPDVVHIFGQNFLTAAVLNYARRNKIKTLIELCNEMPTPHHYIPFPYKYFISGMPPEDYMFISISEMLQNMCLENGVSDERIWTRPNPVDHKVFYIPSDEEKLELRKKLTPFGDCDKVISYIAKFRQSKNHSFLLEVLLKLPKEYKLLLGGPLVESGPETEVCRKIYRDIELFIKDNKLQERVHFFNGFVKNMDEYYKLSDVYAFPTLEEGLGTPMLEALACGVPVVANLIKNVTDKWIKNNENGFVSAADSDIFAENIKKAVLFSKEKLRKEAVKIMKVAGTDVIDAKYWELMNA